MRTKSSFVGTATVLLLLLAMGAFAAGGNEKTASSAALPNIEISVAMWQGDQWFPSGKSDAMYDKIQKKLGITIKAVPYGWDDFAQKSATWAAANDLPDITCAAPDLPSVAQWAEGGVIRSLPQDLSSYPNLKKYLDQPEMKLYTYGGKVYAIKRFQFADPAYQYRQTSLVAHREFYEPLGLSKFPETMDDLRSMLRAMKAKFPTVTPLVFWNTGGTQYIVSNYMPAMDGWVLEGGKYIPGFFSKATIEAVKAFRALVADGVIDMDFPTQTSDAGRIKWINKEGAVMTASPMPGHWPQTYDQYNAKWGGNVYNNIVWGQAPKGPDGKYYFNSSLSWSESYIGSKVDDKKLDRILMLYDYLVSPQGEDFRRYGVEGVDFTRKNGQLTITRPKNDDGTFKALANMYLSFTAWSYLATWDEGFPFVDPTVDPKLHQLGADYQTWKRTKAIALPGYNQMLNTLSTPLKDKFALNTQEELWKLFLSTGNLQQEWDAVVQKYTKAGLNEMVDEVNRIGKEKGLIR